MNRQSVTGRTVVLAVSQDPGAFPGHDVPDTDFRRLAELTGGEVVGNTGFHPRMPLLKRFEKATALDLSQAMHILRHCAGSDVFVSFSERIGIPLGMMLAGRRRRPAHIVIAHRLNTGPKRWIARLTRWQRGVDRLVTLCSAQHAHALRLVGDRAVTVRAGVTDNRYYFPTGEEEDYVLSVGNESRDYGVLFAAASNASLPVKVLSSSPWCRRNMNAEKTRDNIEFLPRVGYSVLRELYQKARLVAVPLHDVDYAAGHNAVCEAFCVNKPLIVSSSRGIMDYVSHLTNSYVVPVCNTDAMTAALTSVYADSSIRETLIRGAEAAVKEYAGLDVYAVRLESLILGVGRENT